MWLAIVTNLSIIQYIGYGNNAEEYSEGLVVIPILAMASVLLGIYYNLTVWYKLTNQTLTGAWITLAGAIITIGLNIWWIPIFGYVGSAWATLCCYAFMMVISYWLGQKYYPVPYASVKLLTYLATAVALYFVHTGVESYSDNIWFGFVVSIILMMVFMGIVILLEKKELVNLPFFKRFLRP